MVATCCLPEPCCRHVVDLVAGQRQRLAASTARWARSRRARRGARACTRSRRGPCPGGSTAAGRPLERLVGDRQVEPVAELLELVLRQLLHLVGRVAALEVRAERPALDGLGQDHRRLADVLARGLVRGVHLAVVVTAARQAAQISSSDEVLDHLAQPRVAAEEVLADVGAGLGRVGLELAVGRGVHQVDQHAVACRAASSSSHSRPQIDLDDVPAGAAEVGLQLLDDLAVAAHRTVEPLQVAVDDEGQVVELLARGEADRAERLRLVHLAVAEERPDVLLAVSLMPRLCR